SSPARWSSISGLYSFSLHDALPITWCLRPGMTRLRRSRLRSGWSDVAIIRQNTFVGTDEQAVTEANSAAGGDPFDTVNSPGVTRSEEHTSELQSRENLVCRLLLEKK